MRSEGRPHPTPLLSFDLLRIKKERELDMQSLNAQRSTFIVQRSSFNEAPIPNPLYQHRS